MSYELRNATSASNSAFRVVCGELTPDSAVQIHPEAIFGVVKSGSAVISVADDDYSISKGDIIFIAPSTKHKYVDKGNTIIDIITLNFSKPTSVTQDYMPQSMMRGLINGSCTSFAKIGEKDKFYAKMLECIRIVNEAETDKFSFYQLLVYGKMYELFYMLFSNEYIQLVDSETKSKKYMALLRVTHYIDDHYCDGVSLEEVASATGISRYYVSHLFKELMDTTFVSYVNELRLNRAALLLATTSTPIIEIASMSGFNNLSNFNRAFKMYFGKTPSAYRKS